MKNRPIAIVDSGSGGLSILQSVYALLPKESMIYLGDHAYLPYGNRSTDVIKERMVKCIKFVLSKKVKLIVIACNTATVAGIEYFRSKFPSIPIVGVVPVVKTAASVSQTKHFIILSTKFTAQSQYQWDLIKKWASDCTVRSVGSSSLVPLIEEGNKARSNIDVELQRVFSAIKPADYDVVVLGCTHYPFIRSSIRAIVGEKVKILDSGGAVARQVQRILLARNELSRQKNANIYFFTTGERTKVERVFRQLLQQEVAVTHVTL